MCNESNDDGIPAFSVSFLPETRRRLFQNSRRRFGVISIHNQIQEQVRKLLKEESKSGILFDELFCSKFRDS